MNKDKIHTHINTNVHKFYRQRQNITILLDNHLDTQTQTDGLTISGRSCTEKDIEHKEMYIYNCSSIMNTNTHTDGLGSSEPVIKGSQQIFYRLAGVPQMQSTVSMK